MDLLYFVFQKMPQQRLLDPKVTKRKVSDVGLSICAIEVFAS